MEPYRAFISDKLPQSQLARGFLTQSMFVGAGAVTANLSLFVFQRLIDGATAAGIPFWVFWAFFTGSVCSIGTVLISVLSTKEIPPTEDELAELRASPSGLGTYIGDIAAAVRAMPFGMHKIGVVFLFQWYAIVVYWQFVATSIGESAFNVTPEVAGHGRPRRRGRRGRGRGSVRRLGIQAAARTRAGTPDRRFRRAPGAVRGGGHTRGDPEVGQGAQEGARQEHLPPNR